MKKVSIWTVGLVVAGCFMSLAPLGWGGELHVDVAQKAAVGRVVACAGVGQSSTDISLDAYGDDTVDRSFVNVGGVYGVSDALDLSVAAALNIKSEVDSLPSDGDGYTIAVGGDYTAWSEETRRVIGYAQLSYTSEDYGAVAAFGETASAEGTLMEVEIGGIYYYDASPNLGLYGGLGLILISDGEADISVSGYSQTETVDFDRDSPVCLRAGAAYNLEEMFVKLDLALVGETTFVLSIGKAF